MKHNPTGLSVIINGRDQAQNKQVAYDTLAERVNDFYQAENNKSYDINRKEQLSDGGRSGKTRTYNFLDNRVVDHNLNKKSHQIDKIMKGRLDLLFNK